MGSLGEQRRDENTFLIESEGRTSTLNGVTIKGFWQNASVEHVQQFTNPEEWSRSAFEVRLPYYALDAPYLVKNGVEMTRSGLGWTGVVRNVTAEDNDDTIIQVNALVLLAAT